MGHIEQAVCACKAAGALGSRQTYFRLAKCWDKYSEEDQEALMGMGYLTAGIKCFLDGFMDACGEHVKTELMDAYFSQAAGRK